MKTRLLAILLFAAAGIQAQKIENLIIITTDGFRWQEVFKGMDSAIANNKKFNQDDSAYIYKTYWATDEIARRQKLLPFLWETVATNGRLYGNRAKGNKIDNANRYWFSYPGYNEIMTGYPDTSVNSNGYPPNPHTNVLEFINRQRGFKGRVAAFGAWDAFDRILNEKRSGFPVYSAFDSFGMPNPNANEKLLTAMSRDAYRPFGEEECLDVFTHYGAMEYLRTRKPRVLYIAYGETDEWAHSGFYKSYLDAAHQVDAWIRSIWDYVQHDPQYRNKTALIITTDHGRGDQKKEEWTSHHNTIAGSHEIWLGLIGPGITAQQRDKPEQLYQQQIAQTIAKLLGLTFTAAHPIAEAIPLQ